MHTYYSLTCLNRTLCKPETCPYRLNCAHTHRLNCVLPAYLLINCSTSNLYNREPVYSENPV